MEPKTIAVEPLHGWGGLKTCQSKIALQWLYYEDTKLGGNRIKHARNGGEQMIRTVEEMYQATQRKTDLLHAAGYKVIDIWECDFKKELKQKNTLMDLVKKYDLDRPPRSKKCILWWTNGDGKMFSQSRRRGADSI